MNQVLYLHNCQNDVISKGRLIIDQIRGEIICQGCGYVIKEKITTQDNEKNVNFPDQYSLQHLIEVK